MLLIERAVDLSEGGGGIGDVGEVHAGRNLSQDVRKIIPALKRSSCRDQLRGLIVVDLRPAADAHEGLRHRSCPGLHGRARVGR